ncbi:ABC transporter ATP-binding protein [Phaeobacter sp. 11ANDIMAR09]|uniref:iron ABC transporter ATP-binding protein n=1 Tax=Phaeobacter sp. 11ANDIMAR09 TaxID=1225647 RepID=UPI0006C84B24|nr:ATP-binding cassette domain-containing protein [Phaeobacter sp. 11ANDIMAR09]KPD12885.1 ABC transporter ATP-binding protein [Phaeobacter sp. 11ANDIMAR09]
MIRIRNVGHQIAGQSILQGVDLDIPQGGLTALVGPNGAGKSTLLSLVARLQTLQSGQIEINGRDLGQISHGDLAQLLAILPQVLTSTHRISVQDLVGFGRYPYSRGRLGPKDREIIADVLESFELQEIKHRFLDTLSGGQRQRAYTAMAWAQDTEYLLLDEPLNNLDIAASRSLMSRLKTLAAQQGRTIVIVLHDINYAAGYADHIVAMKAGRVETAGPPAEVVSEAFLRAVFDTDARVILEEERPLVVV